MQTHIRTSQAAVLAKATREFLTDGFIDSVTAMDLVLEGLDPETVIEQIEATRDAQH